MFVSATSSLVSAYLTAQNAGPSRQYSVATPATTADTVSISDAGRQAASAAGVEQYAIPGWLADFGFVLPSEVATPQADGTLTGGSRSDWFEQRYPQAAAASQSDRNTYGRLINEHYRSVLDENGITDTASHYQRLIADPASSEKLHQQMVERIKADPALMALLPRMGKAHLVA